MGMMELREVAVWRQTDRPGGIPLSVEWPFIEDDGDTEITPTVIKQMVLPKEGWEEVWEEIRIAHRKKTQIRFFHGIPFCVPITEERSNLNVLVSLDMDEATTWEAIKQVVRSVNSRPEFGLLSVLHSAFSGGVWPEEYRCDRCITLDLDDVPAREALCAIAAQAPLQLRFLYSNNHKPSYRPDFDPRSHLQIQFYRNGERIFIPRLEVEPLELYRWSHKERQEAEVPLEPGPE